MGYQVIPSDSTHKDSYPSLYEANHGDYYLSFLPLSVPLSLFTVPNGNPLGNSVLSLKALYTFWGVYQVSESTYMKWRWDVIERRGGIRGVEEGRALKWKDMEEKEKILEATYGKEERLLKLDL